MYLWNKYIFICTYENVLHIQDFKDLLREEAKLVKKNFEPFLKKNIKYRKVQTIRSYGQIMKAVFKPEILTTPTGEKPDSFSAC